MRGLRDALEQSEKDGVAIGHFNVADWVLLKAVGIRAGAEGAGGGRASEGEREFFGVRQIAALVRSLRVGSWHVSTVFECPPFGRCWGQTGHRDRAKREPMTRS
jgi:hypothetical protein